MTNHEGRDASLDQGSAGMMMSVDLRCPNRSKHAVLYTELDVVEIKCDRSHCGAGRGKVVLHRYSTLTGQLTETLRFAEPHHTRKD